MPWPFLMPRLPHIMWQSHHRTAIHHAVHHPVAHHPAAHVLAHHAAPALAHHAALHAAHHPAAGRLLIRLVVRPALRGAPFLARGRRRILLGNSRKSCGHHQRGCDKHISHRLHRILLTNLLRARGAGILHCETPYRSPPASS